MFWIDYDTTTHPVPSAPILWHCCWTSNFNPSIICEQDPALTAQQRHVLMPLSHRLVSILYTSHTWIRYSASKRDMPIHFTNLISCLVFWRSLIVPVQRACRYHLLFEVRFPTKAQTHGSRPDWARLCHTAPLELLLQIDNNEDGHILQALIDSYPTLEENSGLQVWSLMERRVWASL